ncbi:MAG TPA: MaoC/PaaZ C-terminal domain-containing protein [Solirubrobacteraceae bacterium]|nr:MaoC/PaaZ C-terminal domain-containing protein [Solirubrobacteraceae bacterium]
MFWSDPFDELSVGQRFQCGERTVRDTDVIVFSALTGDWHPQHCDPDWAAASPFGERIAHGMLILSLAVGMVPLDPERVLALRRVGDVVFKRPVRLNEVISVAGELTALRPVDERAGLVDFRWAIRNQEDALVARAEVQVLWRRDDAVAERSQPAFWHELVAHGASPGEFIPLPL